MIYNGSPRTARTTAQARETLKEALGIPKCNCVYYELDGGSFICVRPSGTEPKLKVYYSVKAVDATAAESKLTELQAAVANLLASVK